ncbi:MAG TPA: NYN domain-containing protein [bacterium]|nr:NYN domain-containing protein [bacterium]
MALKAQRVGIFVDVQNLFYSAKYQHHSKVDFSKLLNICLNERQLIRAIAYIVQTPDIDQTTFINILNGIGYEIKSKDLRVRPDGTAKGDWDMGIAIDTIAMAERLDVVVLVSGDGDFCDLIHMLKAKGVVTEVVSFPNNTSEDLKKAATMYIPLDKNVLIPGSKA